MIPRAETERPCESCGAPAEADLCPHCTIRQYAAWVEIWRHVTGVRVLLEVTEGEP